MIGLALVDSRKGFDIVNQRVRSTSNRTTFSKFLLCMGLLWQTGLNLLQKLQIRAARVLANSRHSKGIVPPSEPLILMLGWTTVEELVAQESKLITFNSQREIASRY